MIRRPKTPLGVAFLRQNLGNFALHQVKLRARAVTLLSLLVAHLNDEDCSRGDWTVFPSNDYLEEYLGISASVLDRARVSLIEKGYVTSWMEGAKRYFDLAPFVERHRDACAKLTKPTIWGQPLTRPSATPVKPVTLAKEPTRVDEPKKGNNLNTAKGIASGTHNRLPQEGVRKTDTDSALIKADPFGVDEVRMAFAGHPATCDHWKRDLAFEEAVVEILKRKMGAESSPQITFWDGKKVASAATVAALAFYVLVHEKADNPNQLFGAAVRALKKAQPSARGYIAAARRAIDEAAQAGRYQAEAEKVIAMAALEVQQAVNECRLDPSERRTFAALLDACKLAVEGDELRVIIAWQPQAAEYRKMHRVWEAASTCFGTRRYVILTDDEAQDHGLNLDDGCSGLEDIDLNAIVTPALRASLAALFEGVKSPVGTQAA